MNKVFTFLRESQTARFFIPFGIILIAFGVFMFIVNKLKLIVFYENFNKFY